MQQALEGISSEPTVYSKHLVKPSHSYFLSPPEWQLEAPTTWGGGVGTMKDVPQRRTKGTMLPDLDSWPLQRRGVRLTPPGQRLGLPLSFQKLANCIR